MSRTNVEVPMDEADFDFIQEVLKMAKKQYKANAKRCLTGYGSARSKTKSEEYFDKADQCDDLETKLASYFLY